MIEAHTVDAWTRDADRTSIAFRDARIVGGLAAPLFLWLAGIGLALSAAATVRRTGSRRAAVETICRRGLEIFVLAFLFRIQAFVLSPGSELLTLFRVDILNIMGPAIVFAGLVWGFNATTRGLVVSYAAMTISIAMLTPVVRTSTLLDALPSWVNWYLRPAGQQTTFVAFPWAGFVFAGAATGALLAAVDHARDERRLQAVSATIGVALVALGFYTATLPSLYRQSSFWTSSPAYFAIRVGILMVAFAAIFVVERISHESAKARNERSRFRVLVFSWQIPLQTVGQSSLFVYWIHVELVYGYATWPIHNRLPLWGALAACAIFSGLMYAAVLLKERIGPWRPAVAGSNRPSTGLKEAT